MPFVLFFIFDNITIHLSSQITLVRFRCQFQEAVYNFFNAILRRSGAHPVQAPRLFWRSQIMCIFSNDFVTLIDEMQVQHCSTCYRDRKGQNFYLSKVNTNHKQNVVLETDFCFNIKKNLQNIMVTGFSYHQMSVKISQMLALIVQYVLSMATCKYPYLIL